MGVYLTMTGQYREPEIGCQGIWLDDGNNQFYTTAKVLLFRADKKGESRYITGIDTREKGFPLAGAQRILDGLFLYYQTSL